MIFSHLPVLADLLTPPPDVLSPHSHFHEWSLLFGYGILLLVGGIIGYVKAKSTPSLIAGGGSGLLAIILSFLVAYSFTPYAAIVLSLVLLVVMGRRYLVTKKVMPALFIVILSLVVVAAEGYNIIKHWH